MRQSTTRCQLNYAKPLHIFVAEVVDAKGLWDLFKDDFCEDYQRQGHDKEAALNLSLHSINEILRQNNTSCENLGLPQPTDEKEVEELSLLYSN